MNTIGKIKNNFFFNLNRAVVIMNIINKLEKVKKPASIKKEHLKQFLFSIVSIMPIVNKKVYTEGSPHKLPSLNNLIESCTINPYSKLIIFVIANK